MTEISSPKKYDLEERTLSFARNTLSLTRELPKTIENIEVAKQVIRSAGSVSANYIEANEALSRKDFAMRIKICRKEAKESRYWFNLVACSEKQDKHKNLLIQEATELMKIFGAILEKVK